MPENIITIDGLNYDMATIPPHVLQLIDALGRAQRIQHEKQTELLLYNHAVTSISQQVRGALSVIPPFAPEAVLKDNPEDVHQD